MTRQTNGGAHDRAMTSRNGAITWRANAMMAFDSDGGDLLGAVPGPVVHSCHMLRGFEVCVWANNFSQAQWAAFLNRNRLCGPIQPVHTILGLGPTL